MVAWSVLWMVGPEDLEVSSNLSDSVITGAG